MNEETTDVGPLKESGSEKSSKLLHSTVAYQTITPTVSDRYSTLKFHARGGVGEVWLAEDGEIGRQVALKRLSRNDDGANERFIAEAQIAGQLEHPGIVPVHDLGIDKSGKPYYVMKFVHGRTLQDAIEEYHAGETTNESERALQQQRLLDHFVDVCEAVAFAHTRGVVHRDLKPSNIMLGLFGETIVLDWGLAKVLHQPELPGLQTAVTSSGRSSETAFGSVLGTPSYMPPEIAEGKATDAGPATDVYLLGATLYEILTGNVPRSGSSHAELIELARTVAPVPPRQKNKKVARLLEAICLKAMAKREVDRYDSALEIAEDIRRYLAGEPVSTYREPLITRAWRWGKRHRRGLARATSAAMIAAVVVVAAAATRQSSQRAKLAEETSASLVARQRAQAEIQEFRDKYDEAVFYIGSERGIDAGNGNQQFTYFNPGLGRQSLNNALAIAQLWGPALESLPIPEQREGTKRERYELLLLKAQLATMFPSSDLPTELSDALDLASSYDNGLTRSFYRLRAEYHRGQGLDEKAAEDDQLAEADNVPTDAFDHFLRGEQLRTRSDVPDNSADKFARTRPRELNSAIAEYRKALQIDSNHYWSRLQLGRCYLATGRLGEAIEALGACTALWPDSPWAYTARATALARQGRFDEALGDLNHVLQIQPDFHPARLSRGWVLWQKQNLNQAIADFQDVLAVPDKPLIIAAFYWGQLEFQRNDFDEALKQFDTFAAGTQESSFRPVHRYLARINYLLGKNDVALQHLNTSLKLASPDGFAPDSPEAQFERGRFLREMNSTIVRNLIAKAGIAYRAAKTPANATRRRERRALRSTLLKLAIQELQDAEAGIQTAALYYELGLVHEGLRDYETAEEIFGKGLAIDANSIRLRNKRGKMRWDQKKYDLAHQDYAKATDSDPQGVRDYVLLAEAHSWCAVLHTREKQIEEANQHAAQSVGALLDVPAGDEDTFIVLHNIACVYGGVSALDEVHRVKLQDMAIERLEQSIEHARAVGEIDVELNFIQTEDEQFFGPALKARADFMALLNANAPANQE
jgi:serine/threonine protein kinase/Tfp pilus assembly protein PilF